MTGLGLLLQGRDLNTNGFYNFHFSEGWNQRHGNMPEEENLAAARRTNSFLGPDRRQRLSHCQFPGEPGGWAGRRGTVDSPPLAIYLSSLEDRTRW